MSLLQLSILLALDVGAAPRPEALLAQYDAIMAPPHFESVTEMTVHRDDNSIRTYQMRLLKSGDDLLRLWFLDPATVRGQELLRQGNNLWVYLPTLKKPTRLPARESFQGGDFNNGDIMRVHYQTDYAGTVLAASTVPHTWQLQLKAKSRDASYDAITLWMQKTTWMPVRAEYYSASGKVLRVAEFSDVRDFGGFKRPAKISMRNTLASNRFSLIVVRTFDARVTPPQARFVVDDLGR